MHSPAVVPSWTLAALGCLMAALLHPSWAPPPDVTDLFGPECGELLPDPPPGGWLSWSDPATWHKAGVPGVGDRQGANVTIPCGKGVLLDVPRVDLTALEILGALKIKDSPSLALVNLTAAFIIVKGRFIAGNSKDQFKQKVEICLKPNPNNRADYVFTSPHPAEPEFPRSIGHKAFAIVGGQVDFHGLPGRPDMLTWTRLAATADAGTSTITVQGDVSDWPVGAPLVIAPSDFYPNQEDLRTISGISCQNQAAGPSCTIQVNQSLTFNHFSALVPDGFGGTIQEAAEVALLSRNIVITGTDEPGEHQLEGGHFIVFMTQTQQVIEGVEFLLMGQQGRLGRYSLHFHVCKDQDNNVIRKNLILHSKQRCVVLHATFDAVVDSNVAYNTSGHCFMLEEGSEVGNTFINNLGLRTRAVMRVISRDETDNQPGTFWISNPNNSYIGNAAGGSEDSGFWLELRYAVRGMSRSWDRVNQTVPISIPAVGRFSGNTAHSNLFGGLRMYPNGFMPRRNSSLTDPVGGQPVWVKLGNFNFWKNNQVGAFIHATDHLVFSNSTLADNTWGIQVTGAQAVNVTGHRIVGASDNYGNPSSCQYTWGRWYCQPVAGCKFPLPAGVLGRSVGGGIANHTVLGVLFDENRAGEDRGMANWLSDSTFSSFDNACHVAAAVAVAGSRANFWSTGHGFSSIKFSGTTKTNQAFLFPKDFPEPNGIMYHAGEPATMFALRDLDGSITGSPGYVVANNPALLPPPSSSLSCSFNKDFNAYLCPGACYRTVQVMFDEPGFAPYPRPKRWFDTPDGPRVLGDFSYLKVTRLEDDVTFTLEGNLHQYRTGFDNGISPLPDFTRIFPMSLLGGYTYEVKFMPAIDRPDFLPNRMVLQYKDGTGCGQGVTIRFTGSPSQEHMWTVQPSELIAWAPCPGNEAVLRPSVAPVTFGYVCVPSALTRAAHVRTGSAPKSTAWATSSSMETQHTVAYSSRNKRSGPSSAAWATSSSAEAQQSPEYSLRDKRSGSGGTKCPLRSRGSGCAARGALEVLGSASDATAARTGPQTHAHARNASQNPSPSPDPTSSRSPSPTSRPEPRGQPAHGPFPSGLQVLQISLPSTRDQQTLTSTVKIIPVRGEAAACSAATTCGLLGARTTWHYNQQNRDLHPTYAGGKGFYNPLYPTPAPDWLSGPAPLGYEGWSSPAIQTFLNPPDWGALRTYYFKTSFVVKNSACYSHLLINIVLLDGAVVYLNNVEILRANMPAGRVNNMTSALRRSKSGPVGWKKGYTYTPFNLSLAGHGGNVSLVEGVNHIAAEVHTHANRGWNVGYALQASAVMYPGCAGARVETEVCDGLDNDDDGKVDVDPESGSLLKRPCWSACGSGYETCVDGAFQSCSAPLVYQETCNGKDDNCDGLVDNGIGQLDCPSGSACLAGKCQPVQACVGASCAGVPVIKQMDTWRFLDASLPLPPSDWAMPSFSDGRWLSGLSPIGNGIAAVRLSTVMKLGKDLGNGRITYYFRKSFTISNITCFTSLTLSVFCNDGAVVYINGAQASHFNMPRGNISAVTPAKGWATWEYQRVPLSPGWFVPGSNTVAVELHQSLLTAGKYALDLTLTGSSSGDTCHHQGP